jgi:hypothetical protein
LSGYHINIGGRGCGAQQRLGQLSRRAALVHVPSNNLQAGEWEKGIDKKKPNNQNSADEQSFRKNEYNRTFAPLRD